MYTQLCRRFSSYNKRTHVPKILKDPKFSRKGIVLKKRVTEVEHDVSGEYVHNSHLYYSWTKRQAMEQQYNLAKEAVQQQKLQALSQEQQVIALLQDPVVVQKADATVICLMTQLADMPASPQNNELINKVLKQMSSKMYQLSLEEVKQVVLLQQSHGEQNGQVWKSITWAIRRIAASCIYHQHVDAQDKSTLMWLAGEVPIDCGLSAELQHPVFL